LTERHSMLTSLQYVVNSVESRNYSV